MSTITGKLTRPSVTGRVASCGALICTPSSRLELPAEVVLPESFIEPLAEDGTFSLELDDTDNAWWWTITEDVARGRTRHVAVNGDSTYADLEEVDPSSGAIKPPLPPVWKSYIDAALAVVANGLTALAARVTTNENTIAGRLSDASIAAKITAGITGKADSTAVYTKSAADALRVAGDTTASVTSVTNDYTLLLSDAGKVIEANKATAVTVTIPPESSVAWPTGALLEVFQLGVGQVTIAGGVGVTIVAPFGAKTAAQSSSVGLRKRAVDTWVLSGDTTT